MKKNLLILILLIFLVVMNGVLLFLLLNKPNRENRPPRDFITHQLGFDEEQLQEFSQIDAKHHRTMRGIDMRSMDLKNYLFTQLGKNDFPTRKLDSVTVLIGNLSKEREKEVFNYFTEIEKVCNQEQKSKLETILSGALRHGRNAMGPERMGPEHMRPEGMGPERMGPPPHRE